MSERSQVMPAPEGEYFEPARFTGLSLLLAGGAVVGLVLCLFGALKDQPQFSFSWLFGFAYSVICATTFGITPPMPSGRWSCGDNWKTSDCFSARCFCLPFRSSSCAITFSSG